MAMMVMVMMKRLQARSLIRDVDFREFSFSLSRRIKNVDLEIGYHINAT